jgi:hypothetical protein
MSLNALFYLIIAAAAILWARSVMMKQQDIRAGKRYCEENGLKFINGKVYEQHIRLHYEKDGVKGWANYVINREGEIKWVKETPLEKLENKT